MLTFGPATANMRVLIACTCAGLIATSLVMMPVRGASEALAMPLVAGSFIALYKTDVAAFMWLAALLMIYTIFVLAATNQIRRLFERYTLARLQQEEQNDFIQLLLGEGDQISSRWLWETDVESRFCYVNSGLAEALGHPAHEIEGTSFFKVLGTHPRTEDDNGGERAALMECIQDRVFFRNIAIPVLTDTEPKWWSITGSPNFDAAKRFTGYKGVASDITASRKARAVTAHRALHDALTGLPNRHAFGEALRQALAELGRAGEAFALLSIDLDGFKAINDSLGHAAGDALLKATAARLRQSVRHSDLIARLGGDEFMILQRGATVPALGVLAQRLLDQFKEPFNIEGESKSIGLSIGISIAPLGGDTSEALLEAADMALYQAKRHGGDCHRFYEPELKLKVQAERGLLRDLRKAIEARVIDVVYQPIVDAQTLAIRGFETLARWRHPDIGPVSPEKFIRLAEEGGLIEELGEWILEQACKEATTWPETLKVSVNVSVGQLFGDDFPSRVFNILQRTGLAAARLELEVTESIFMDTEKSCFGVLEGLRDLGIHVALDDFGRGFSSLAFLSDFPFAKIKMDSSFVRDMVHDRRSAAVVHAVIGLAANLGIVVTAEGVERSEQLVLLRRQGCTEAQGYLFSRPLPKHMIPGLLAELRHNAAEAAGSTTQDYIFDLNVVDYSLGRVLSRAR